MGGQGCTASRIARKPPLMVTKKYKDTYRAMFLNQEIIRILESGIIRYWPVPLLSRVDHLKVSERKMENTTQDIPYA